MRSKVVSIFDLDHTLLTANCSFRFGAYLYRKQGFSLFSLFYSMGCYGLHKMDLLSVQRLHERLFKQLFKGSSALLLKQFVVNFVSDEIPHLLYQPVLTRLQKAQELGHRIFILSSSPDFIVSEIVRHFQVQEWRATPYLLDSEQRFSSIGTVLCGQEKRALVMKLEEATTIYAYSDSHLDLPLLEASTHPVGVNPDRSLRSICQRRGWEIL
jgi:HAD superfamily phosphoserine phosphatase-like hydrolase